MHIASLSVMRFASLPPARQAVLSARRDVELAEFARNVREDVESRQPAVKPEEMQGRTTGSVEWRAARGELGSNPVAVERALNSESTASAASSSSSSSASSSAPTPAAAAVSSSSTAAAASSSVCKTDESKAQCSTNPSAAAASASATDPAASSAASSASSAVPSANIVAAARARTAALFRSYTTQLSVGCGRDSCATAQCKSNAAFTPPSAPADLAKLALELTKTGVAQLCPGIAASKTAATK